MNLSYGQILTAAAPETIITIVALGVLAADLVALRDVHLQFRRIVCGLICAAGCVIAIGWMIAVPQYANVQNGMFIVDSLSRLLKIALVGLGLLTVLLSIETTFTPHVGEYFAAVLFAVLGMMFLASTEDVLMIFISLEITSLSLYVLTAFNKRNIKSAEAALKYFLFGGVAAAFTLFGLSLLYGISGSTNLREIAVALKAAPFDSLSLVAIVMTIAGFGFKVAAVPFHLWAPDAYEGAPATSAALIASGSKVASFFVLAKILIVGFAGAEGAAGWRAYVSGWVPVIATLAIISMVLGNFAAIAQTSVRRLLAYSAIAHAGYMLVGLLSHNSQSVGSITYYAITYGLTLVGAFGVVSLVQERTGGDSFENFAGLSRRSPLLSFCMLIFILSLAGIPPLPGFFGKFFVFTSALNGSEANYGLLWLVVAAISLSTVSLYYYLKVLKQIYVLPRLEIPERNPFSAVSQVVICLIAVCVILLGLAPEIILSPLEAATKAAGL